MAYPIVPPPANDPGAITWPRMLQRWLDVNRISQLTRTATYITLPAFSIDAPWNGYSEIVASYNLEGPNNFSFLGVSEPIPNPNYLLAVMWKDEYGNTHRYAIWKNVGEKGAAVYFPLYTGQVIMKNFRFEIWNTSNVTTSVQTSSINYYTSVAGLYDYRWGQDSLLVNSDPQNLLFDCASQSATPPNDVNNLILSRYVGWANFSSGTWTSTDGIDTITGLGQHAVSYEGNVFQGLSCNGSQQTGTSQGTINDLFVCFQFSPVHQPDSYLIQYDNGYQIWIHNNYSGSTWLGDLYVNGTLIGTMIAGHIYTLACFQGSYAYLIETQSNTVIGQAAISVSIGITTTITLGAPKTTGGIPLFNMLEILPYYNLQSSNIQTVYNYFRYTYAGNFLLPLVFPVNSQPQPNNI